MLDMLLEDGGQIAMIAPSDRMTVSTPGLPGRQCQGRTSQWLWIKGRAWGGNIAMPVFHYLYRKRDGVPHKTMAASRRLDKSGALANLVNIEPTQTTSFPHVTRDYVVPSNVECS